jgi:hypothetical protein
MQAEWQQTLRGSERRLEGKSRCNASQTYLHSMRGARRCFVSVNRRPVFSLTIARCASPRHIACGATGGRFLASDAEAGEGSRSFNGKQQSRAVGVSAQHVPGHEEDVAARMNSRDTVVHCGQAQRNGRGKLDAVTLVSRCCHGHNFQCSWPAPQAASPLIAHFPNH